ncbi:LuxR C-terminal-related transcriptional regulator [Vibrio sp. AND4]|uniref:response regulator transcription factor n=1 Tax=Vibrio sp. AND4 TaxID=314289 RepID=UPI00015EFBD9|nr:LuxR C-terminal-related transcriptional regulator [Vibrio sp. AND4]EDP59845.1 two component transcriptional regulator, LuxR family protein [Vibrio sp. AND4]
MGSDIGKTTEASFEALVMRQANKLTTSHADECQRHLEQFMLEAMDWFDIDRMTIFPNSMLFFNQGKTLSVARPPHKLITASQVGVDNAERYLQLIGNSKRIQIFDKQALATSNVVILRMLSMQGACFHYTIPLTQFGQRWGGLSFTLFGCDGYALTENQIEQMTFISHMWLSFWQHSKLHRSLHRPGMKTDQENHRMLRLSHRQCDVLGLLAKGLSTKEIATALNLSPRTIESHKYRLLDMLELDNHADLVQFAIRNGIGY